MIYGMVMRHWTRRIFRKAPLDALLVCGVILAALAMGQSGCEDVESAGFDAPQSPRLLPDSQTQADRPADDRWPPASTVRPDSSGPALEQIDSILALDPAERGALDVAMSRRQELTGSALYFMMDKASRLPTLTGEELNALDRPSYHNLIHSPQRYAGRPIRMRVLVQLVQKQTAGVPGELGIDRTHWRQGRVAWLIDGFDADGEFATQRPVRIFSVADPTPILPEPVKIVNDNEWHYPQTLVEVDLAGVFYKVWEHEDRESDKAAQRLQPGEVQLKRHRSYPIIIAWQLNPVGVSRVRQPDSFAAMDFIGFVVIGLVFMVVVFFLLARHVRRTRRARRSGTPFWEGKYSSLRDEEADDDQRPNDMDIDPALKAAADDYHRQHEQDRPNG